MLSPLVLMDLVNSDLKRRWRFFEMVLAIKSGQLPWIIYLLLRVIYIFCPHLTPKEYRVILRFSGFFVLQMLLILAVFCTLCRLYVFKYPITIGIFQSEVRVHFRIFNVFLFNSKWIGISPEKNVKNIWKCRSTLKGFRRDLLEWCLNKFAPYLTHSSFTKTKEKKRRGWT